MPSRAHALARRRLASGAAACLALAALAPVPAAAQSDAEIVQKRNEVREMAREALSSLFEIVPGARPMIEHAAGFGVFSTFGVKFLFAGGTTGKGVVIDNRTRRETFMRMIGAQAGLGFGAKSDRLIFVFETRQALRNFVEQGWEFGGQANLAATVSDQGAMMSGAVAVSPGVYVFQITSAGLAAQLTFSGTKYFRDDDLH
jgi:lipid-binding SYLF domain-containing protein